MHDAATWEQLMLDAGRRLERGLEADDAVVVLAHVGSPGASAVASRLLERAVGEAWERGWQPADLMHVARQRLSQRASRLLVAVIGVEATRSGAHVRAPATWMAQLQATGATDGPCHDDCVAGWAGRDVLDATAVWTETLRLLGMLVWLGQLDEVGPPPSRWEATAGSRPAATRVADPKMLARIRALLAKAESTTFAAEAETYAAKAQDLMTRYSVDVAVAAAADAGGSAGSVQARRVHVDHPYVRAKAQLLFGVASVNGVQGVLHRRYGIAVTVGMPVDLDLVEMLFTSLLVQATRALTELADSQQASRGRAFRRGFLSAFAARVTARLAQAGADAQAGLVHEHGSSLVPVLAARREAVEQTFDRLFPKTVSMRSSPVDERGWLAGTAAADRADLRSGGHAGRLAR